MAYYEQFDWDPDLRREERIHIDPVTGAITIEKITDIGPGVDFIKSAYSSRRRGNTWSKQGDEHVAWIPNHILWELDKKGILRDQKKLERWLNSTEGSACKTRPGTV